MKNKCQNYQEKSRIQVLFQHNTPEFENISILETFFDRGVTGLYVRSNKNSMLNWNIPVLLVHN